MTNRNYLPANIRIVFPKTRSFKNEAAREEEALWLSLLVSGLNYRVAGLN